MSKLSQINETPIYTTTLPSTGEKVKFRPFLSKEERILLTASESEDVEVMYSSLEAVVRNCLITEVKDLSTFDIEFMFVQLRSKSVGETSEVTIKCSSCGVETMNSVELLTSQIIKSETHTKKIKLADNIVALMRYPTVDDVLAFFKEPTNSKLKEDLGKRCIVTIYHNDDIYNMEEETAEEKNIFFESLRPQQTQMIRDFVDDIPYLQLTHKWTCPHCKSEEVVTLKGIFSFF
jgi:transcription elongation factor Elf1